MRSGGLVSAAVSAHRAVIEVGPGAIRRLCCGTSGVADSELEAAALGAIDDELALVAGSPVAVGSLWSSALRTVDCGSPAGAIVVHPSWWSPSRVGVVTAAARAVANDPNDVVVQPRAWLFSRGAPEAAVVVEIAERLVAIAGAEVVAVPRTTEPQHVADEVARLVAGTAAVAVVDAPNAIAGAAALATLITAALRGRGTTVMEIDDARLSRLANAAQPVPEETAAPARSASRHGKLWLAAAAVVLAALAPVGGHHRAPAAAPAQQAPTTFLVEGRVALTVPANWPTQRVVTGTGSARVQVSSPSDPEVALHVTQSAVPGETLGDAAERLKRAIEAEPTGVFVDFNPAGVSAGRPAVTYREIRATHHVRWTVLLDGAVRISVGCQSRPGREDVLRDVCEQAVRSAHTVG
jgi:type VII secretion-associated protein (TIGR03931 family)